ncbi:toxin-antitoxin system YwqK family antitoxin [Chryseobacterium sp. 2R14A]|uniref:toxin-antitoxin system YwqK family antitoxin n=1 Tax=Chryseobacterium sp. 2R14A TaxID=3380353 RepID=UPI003CFAD5D8
MIKKSICIISFLLFITAFSQKSEPIYYDKEWKMTAKSNASYYRLMPQKELGELVLLQDFYINGIPQFEGYTLKNNENAYVGDIVWYDENGNDENFKQYRNETKNLTLLYYYPNGKIRKKVQYKNGVKDGETVIYSTDGTVLMKGNYVKGKPESGSFERIKNNDDYDYNEKIQEVSSLDKGTHNDGEDLMVVPPPPPIPQTRGVEPQTLALLEPIGEVKNSSKKIKNQKTVTEKIFWANSKQIAQETVFAIDGGYYKSIEQRNYDKSGKLIQSLNEANFYDYGSDITNGLDYQYYLQNNFATEVKTIIRYAGKLRSGKNFSYFPNGKIATETLYKDGWRDGKEMVYDENGKLKSKRIYKENEPFQGNFDANAGAFIVNLNYVNGLKDGEAVVFNEEKQIVAKGIYKDGKPFDGTFVLQLDDRSDDYELINVDNFKKTGLQKVFGYRLENLEKTYMMKDNKLDGITTFYDKGEITGTLEYKNNVPYNGTLVSEEKTSIYKNGKIIEETYFKNRYNKDLIQKQKIYDNGILIKVKNYSFTISEKPQEFYEGVLKNGKPFSGYFETEDDREFKQVDYFENGTRKFQYSNDYLKNMDNYQYQLYDIKSTYKDGKVFDGVEYNLGNKQFTSRYWKNGVLKSFDWDLFAMHYFNRIHFELKGNVIEIKDMQANKKAEIKIEQSGNAFNKQLSIDGKFVDSTRKEYLESKYKEGLILYREQDGKIVATKVDLADESVEPSEGTELFYKVYMIVKESSNIQVSFSDLSEKFVSNKFMEETDEKEIITGVQTDAEGKPKDGILITPTQNNNYTLQLYMNRKLMKTIEKVSFDKIKDEIKKLERLD